MQQSLRIRIFFIFVIFLLSAQSYAASGSMNMGTTTVSDLSSDASGIGWTWNSTTNTLHLDQSYSGDNPIKINCNSLDTINLNYTGDVTISTDKSDPIYSLGTLRINGSGGTLTLAYTIDNVLYCGLSAMNSLFVESGNLKVSCASSTKSEMGAAAIFIHKRLSISGNANVTATASGNDATGIWAELDNVEISTDGEVVANGTGEGYAFSLNSFIKVLISNGTVKLSNKDNPDNMIKYKNFKLTGGVISYNGGTPPLATSISPAKIALNSSANITIQGSNLSKTEKVLLGDLESTILTNETDNQIIVASPISPEEKTVSLYIETKNGVSILKDALEYSSKVMSIEDSNSDRTEISVSSNNLVVQGQLAIRKIELLDLGGRILEIYNIDNETMKTIDISSLPKGIYMASVTTEQGTVVKRFTK